MKKIERMSILLKIKNITKKYSSDSFEQVALNDESMKV